MRAAQVAFDEGRCEEASALLSRETLRGFLPAKRLSQEVATRLVDRASEKIATGDSVAGWHDIRQVERLGGCEQLVDEFRQEQARRGIANTRRLLECGETAMAERQIVKLQQHRLGGDERRLWKTIVRLITKAKALAYSGDFTQARAELDRVERLLPAGNVQLAEQISSRQAELAVDAAKCPPLIKALHDAIQRQNWTEVLTKAEAVLELAPEHAPALAARRRAWEAVGLKATAKHVQPHFRLAGGKVRSPLAKSTLAWRNSATLDTMTTDHQPGKRLIAWIDEIGGYMICLNDEVFIGQPTPEGGVDIPVRADLSRRHASIRRERENYVLTPIHTTKVDGQTITGPIVLRNQALVELGDSLRLRFTKPHTLSATAVLLVESKHKTEPAVDAIVLMSESCVLGPGSHSHIRCPNWKSDIVLFRRGDDIQFRAKELVEFNDHPGTTSGIITADCRISGENFALSFEEI
ncbi:FHA domain-containing protein [Bythopirellula polymerisocia]|uniref:FHA domain-containing protein n=1 Tax=Bythopirellula polymerisocia TaxID=2528003 RepID=A0A5C6CT13_9BACT|nr:FHA domain-containing protein [Bythopirellula polymerisocia]TWU28083.1 hypothetical protein Pla144_13700 [Bythopirellula polymerisocia]